LILISGPGGIDLRFGTTHTEGAKTSWMGISAVWCSHVCNSIKVHEIQYIHQGLNLVQKGGSLTLYQRAIGERLVACGVYGQIEFAFPPIGFFRFLVSLSGASSRGQWYGMSIQGNGRRHWKMYSHTPVRLPKFLPLGRYLIFASLTPPWRPFSHPP